MDDFLGKLKSGANKVAFEAEKLGKQADIKSQMESIRITLQANMPNWASNITNQRTAGAAVDPGVDELCKAIADLEAKLAAKNAELQGITGQVYQPDTETATPPPPPPAAAEAPRATKFCSSCGKEMAKEAKFCPNCGASN
jgi:ribosomal protein S27AE